ncbi:hypothetical protein AGMMS50239_26010 [Bacteroidia bacterium]|nr:hypothetical protein AGMMS50239_26010 [Bacteroidia bacterium]
MNITLARIALKDEYTIGKLYMDGKYFCDTLELKDRGLKDSMSLPDIAKTKVYGKTAVPTGLYEVSVTNRSEKFATRAWAMPNNGIVPLLLNVKGFDGVRIHVGNKPSDLLGCIAVGVNDKVGWVSNSTITYRNLMNKLLADHNAGNKITINIGYDKPTTTT